MGAGANTLSNLPFIGVEVFNYFSRHQTLNRPDIIPLTIGQWIASPFSSPLPGQSHLIIRRTLDQVE